MVRRIGFLLVLAGALALVPSASAAYPGPIAVQGGSGLPSIDGSVHFIANGISLNIYRALATINGGEAAVTP